MDDMGKRVVLGRWRGIESGGRGKQDKREMEKRERKGGGGGERGLGGYMRKG